MAPLTSRPSLKYLSLAFLLAVLTQHRGSVWQMQRTDTLSCSGARNSKTKACRRAFSGALVGFVAIGKPSFFGRASVQRDYSAGQRCKRCVTKAGISQYTCSTCRTDSLDCLVMVPACPSPCPLLWCKTRLKRPVACTRAFSCVQGLSVFSRHITNCPNSSSLRQDFWKWYCT